MNLLLVRRTSLDPWRLHLDGDWLRDVAALAQRMENQIRGAKLQPLCLELGHLLTYNASSLLRGDSAPRSKARTVGHSEAPGISRMTFVVEGDDRQLRQVETQLDKNVRLTQQRSEEIDRGFRISKTVTDDPDLEIPLDAAGRASKVVQFDANGDLQAAEMPETTVSFSLVGTVLTITTP